MPAIGTNPGIGSGFDPVGKGHDVFVQSNINPPFQYWLIEETITDRVLASSQPQEVEVLPLDDVTGIILGDLLAIFENTLYEQSKIIDIDVPGNTVTIDQKTSFPFSVGASIVIGKNDVINHTGTLAVPIKYKYKPRQSTTPIDIGKLVITIESGNNAPDDSLFGGIEALTNGIYMYKKTATGRLNLGAFHTNADFKDRGAKVEYTEKLVGGIFSTHITFNTREIFNNEIRFFTETDELCLESRDPQVGNVNFTASALGSFTIGEQP
jgi:hypothetical protein